MEFKWITFLFSLRKSTSVFLFVFCDSVTKIWLSPFFGDVTLREIFILCAYCQSVCLQGLEKFYEAVMQAILRHINFDGKAVVCA